jgi:hypothetical protein
MFIAIVTIRIFMFVYPEKMIQFPGWGDTGGNKGEIFANHEFPCAGWGETRCTLSF